MTLPAWSRPRREAGRLVAWASRAARTSLALLCMLVSALVPKRRRSVVLVPRFHDETAGFEGNLKYLFLHLRQAAPDVDARYVTGSRRLHRLLRDNGFPAVLHPTPRSVATLLRTRLVIVDGGEWIAGMRFPLTFASRKVQLWHGSGMKNVGLARAPLAERRGNFAYRALARLLPTRLRYDAVVFGSPRQAEARSDAFAFEESVVNSQPKADVVVGTTFRGADVGCDLEALATIRARRSEGWFVAFLAPTHRPEGSAHVTDVLDLERLNAFGQRERVLFVLKLHPKDRTVVGGDDCVIVYDPATDAYPAFGESDCLVTDYSSIYMDYLLTGQPVVFFAYDLDAYRAERGLAYDYDAITPGPKCATQAELEDVLSALRRGQPDPWVDRRRQVVAEFHEFVDGRACERMVGYLAARSFL